MSDREVMQQALEALERARPQIRGVLPSQDADAAITALRARLAEPQTCKAGLQVEGAEAVAWMVFTQDGQSVFVTDNPTDIGDDQRALPLYTAPPTRRPLTDEEADALAHEMVKGGKSVQWLVRAIERAHKIGGNDE